MDIARINRPANTVNKSLPRKNSENGFAEALEKAEKADRFVLSPKDTKDTSAMTMQEYQLYIYDKIAKMPKGSFGNKDNMVFITDEGYEAMKNDPEYERWALEQIRASFSGGGGHGKAKVHSYQIIGGTKEECRYESFSSDDSISQTEKEREELRRFRLQQKRKREKHAKYIRVLQENLIKKQEKELDHIRGIYRDQIYKQKDICASVNASRFMLWV